MLSPDKDQHAAKIGWSLFACMLVGVLAFAGVFRPIDQTILDTIHPASSETAGLPLVVAMDDALVARWGPPPWTTDRWAELAGALERNGLTDPSFIGSTRFLVTDDGASQNIEVPMIRVVPTGVAVDGEGLARLTIDEPPLPLTLASEPLLLTLDETGALREQRVSDDGSDHWCAWVPGCRAGLDQRVLVSHAYDVPRISASTLLDDDVRLAVNRQSTVLVGWTVPELAPTVLGPNRRVLSLVDAVGQTIAAGRISGLMRRPSPLGVAAGLGCVLALAWLLFWTSTGRIRQSFILWSPIAGLAVCCVVFQSGRILPPFTAISIVSMTPALVVLLLGRERFFAFLRGLDSRLLRVRQSAPFQTRPINTHEQLLVKLGGLTRVYMNTERCAWFQAEPDGGFRFFGGYGVTGNDLGRMPTYSNRSRRRAAPSFDDPDLFVDADCSAVLIPLYEQQKLLGLWCIPRQAHESRPDPGILNSVLRWLEPRLVFDSQRTRPDVLDFRSETVMDRMERLVREHHFQLGTVQNLGIPLAIADISGELQHTNEALRTLLTRVGQPPFLTLRGLLYHLAPTEVEQHTARLYRLLEPVLLTWTPQKGVFLRLQLQPILQSEGAHRDLLGFSVLFAEDGEQFWAPSQNRVALSNQISATLAKRNASLQALRAGLHSTSEPDLHQLLSKSLEEMLSMSQSVERIAQALREPTGSPLQLVDPIHLIRRALEETRPLQDERRISAASHFPEHARSIWLDARAARVALQQFFRYAVRQTPQGGSLQVRLSAEGPQQVVEVQSSGGNLDPYSIQQIARSAPSELDPSLGAFIALKEVFGELDLRSDGQAGLIVCFSLPTE